MKLRWHRACSIFLDSGSDLFELFFSMLLTGTGIGLINPIAHTFEANPRVWQSLAMLAPEWVWGSILLAFGLTQFWAVTGRNRRTREHVAILCAGFWAFMAAALQIASPTGISIYLYAPLAIFQLRTFLWLRARRLSCPSSVTSVKSDT